MNQYPEDESDFYEYEVYLQEQINRELLEAMQEDDDIPPSLRGYHLMDETGPEGTYKGEWNA